MNFLCALMLNMHTQATKVLNDTTINEKGFVLTKIEQKKV